MAQAWATNVINSAGIAASNVTDNNGNTHAVYSADQVGQILRFAHRDLVNVLPAHLQAVLTEQNQVATDCNVAGLLTLANTNTLQAAINSMANLECDICHMPGHLSGYCWFNSQLYQLCHQQGTVAKNSLKVLRANVKCQAMIASKRAKAELEAEILNNQLASNVAVISRQFGV